MKLNTLFSLLFMTSGNLYGVQNLQVKVNEC